MGIIDGVSDRGYNGQMESRSPLGYLLLQPIVLYKTRIVKLVSSKGSQRRVSQNP